MNKEAYYLPYNKDNIAGDLIQSEKHFRKLKRMGFTQKIKGHANCVVKHLLDAESEADELISHSLIAENKEKSDGFARLAENMMTFRRRLMDGKVDADEGIREIRKLKTAFSLFNPEYDVSKCRSCGDISGFIKEFDVTKNLNTQGNNYSNDDDNMKGKNNVKGKDVALIYGGDLIGLGIDAGIDTGFSQWGLPLKAGLAIGLPLASYFIKMPNDLARLLLVMGGYMATKLPAYAAQYITPATRVTKKTVITTPPRVISPNQRVGVAQSKYVIT